MNSVFRRKSLQTLTPDDRENLTSLKNTTHVFVRKSRVNKTQTQSFSNFSSKIMRNPTKSFTQKPPHHRNSSFSEPRKSVLVYTQPHPSSIPAGIETFKILEIVKSKDPQFNIPVPMSIAINCSFSKVLLVDSDKSLKVTKGSDMFQVVQYLKKFNTGGSAREHPLALVKYPTQKKIEFSIDGLINSFPDTKGQFVIQQFLMPKGLRVTKYRVIINEFKKVVIFSNKVRYDSRTDVNKSVSCKQSSINPSVMKTVLMHNDIKKVMNGRADLKDINTKKLENEKFIFFKLFNNAEEPSDEKERNTEYTLSARYLTSEIPERTNFFEGKNQSYSEIIRMTEYLWGKIDFYYLDSCRLIELACDFMQDKLGSWYFIKINHGKTEMKEREKSFNYFKSKRPHLKVKRLG